MHRDIPRQSKQTVEMRCASSQSPFQATAWIDTHLRYITERCKRRSLAAPDRQKRRRSGLPVLPLVLTSHNGRYFRLAIVSEIGEDAPDASHFLNATFGSALMFRHREEQSPEKPPVV